MDLSNLPTGEIILYQPDNTVRLEVRIEDDTVWLTQAQMAELFQTTVPNINLHLKNIFEEGELEEIPTIKDFLIVRQEGNRNVQRNISFYNLDAIISVGYRIKSRSATAFRRWATKVLKEYILKGYAIDRRIERVETFAIETERRVTEVEKKIIFLTSYMENILSDNNEINEDTRMQLENICEELAELQAKNKWVNKPRNPIGFKATQTNDNQ